jgi:(p)ppGpp synthase/HD superfamily hydrolase
MAQDADETRELVERFPSVATPEGLALITQTLERLSFQQATPEEYQRYYNVQRLIARCLEIGIDRALLELR